MKLTREEIECVFDHLREYAYDMFQLTADDTAPPLTTNGARAVLDQIQRLALSTLSQEAVREEALREIEIAITELLTPTPEHRQFKRVVMRTVAALKREPNAAAGEQKRDTDVRR